MGQAATELIDVTPHAPRESLTQRFWSAAHEEPRPLTRGRKALALAIAAAADTLQLGMAPLFGEGFASGFDDALDLGVAMALVGVLGFRPRLLLALVTELVPGMSLFPTWTAVVATLPVQVRLGEPT